MIRRLATAAPLTVFPRDDEFNDRTQACAPCRQPGDCAIPALRERTDVH